MKKGLPYLFTTVIVLVLLAFAYVLLHPLITPASSPGCVFAWPNNDGHTSETQAGDLAITRTATPNGTDIAMFQTQGAKITPQPPPSTPVITKNTDLSPELDDNQKYDVLVIRADGTTEEIKVGPTVHNEPSQLPDGICAKFHLQRGDKIIAWYDIGERSTALGRVKVVATYYAQRDAEAATEKTQWTATPIIWPITPLADLLPNLQKYNDQYVVVSGFYYTGVTWPTCATYYGSYVNTSWLLRASPTTLEPSQMILIENSKNGTLFNISPAPVPGKAFTVRGWLRFYSGAVGCVSNTPGPSNLPVKEIWWIEAESVEMLK